MEIKPRAALFALLGVMPHAQAAPCQWTEIARVHPTQFSVGKIEVEARMQPIRNARGNPEVLEKLIRKRPGQAVLGPRGEIYLIDGHHFAYGLQGEGIRRMCMDIQGDYSDLDEDVFAREMTRLGNAYLRNDEGLPIQFADLPHRISGLRDDPYRSLAWVLEKVGAIHDENLNYQEFEWAAFFRARLRMDFSRPTQARATLQRALDLMEEDGDARMIAGYRHLSRSDRDLSGDGDCALKYRALEKVLFP